MEFSRQEYWSGLLFPSPGDLFDPGTKPRSPALQADALPSESPGIPPWKQKELSRSRRAGFVAPQVAMTTEPQTAEPLCKDCHFTCWSKADDKESLGRPTAYNSTVTEYVSSRCRVSPSSSMWINNEKHFLPNLCKLQNKAWEI